MAADFDYTIIGGGVIGLACARQLAQTGSVLLVERHGLFGSETSSRNSEVIHAGLYYPSGSLKERLCIRGRELLYAYCENNDVPHQRIGKLIVAPDKNHPKLMALKAKADNLGIPIELLDKSALQALEPGIDAAEALYSPETGIIDSHTLMLQLAQDAERLGALLMKQTCFECAEPQTEHWEISLTTADGPYTCTTAHLINAAGLSSHDVARRCGTDINELPALHYCRGHYFSYQHKNPFKHLIYPLPEENLAGLGIHATIDLGGQLRFGPDTCYLEENIANYEIPDDLKETFTQAVADYFPNLDCNALQPAYAGIRPKLSGPGESVQDFVIHSENRLQAPPLLHLLGIESPGLTSSLALAEEIAVRLSRRN